MKRSNNNYSVEMAELSMVMHVAKNMRPEDEQELLATFGQSAKSSVILRQCWLVSRNTTFAGTFKGEPICVFGLKVPSMLGRVAIPWLVGTRAMSLHSRQFLRVSRQVVKLWSREFPVMENYVDARNLDAIRWLQWLGFSVYFPQPFGPDDMPFHRFDMRSSEDV